MSREDPPGVGPEGVDPAFFHDVYQGTAPWDIGQPQPEVVHLLEAHRFTSPILDVGCGTGENTILLAMAGYDITGVDLVPAAIAAAQEAADVRGLDVDFQVADALRLEASLPAGAFRTVLDSGVFHVFSDADRVRYVDVLWHLTAPAGQVHVIVFSDADTGPGGPRRVSRQDLLDAFAAWDLVDLGPCQYLLRDRPARAWRGTWQKPGTTSH